MANPRGINQYSKGGGRRGSTAASGARVRKAANVSSQVLSPGKGVTGSVDRVQAAAIMFGAGSKQHRAAMKKFR